MMKTIYVYENWLSEEPSLIGRLYVDMVRGGESYSFEYDKMWLANPAAVMLDPDLNLYGGRQYPKRMPTAPQGWQKYHVRVAPHKPD